MIDELFDVMPPRSAPVKLAHITCRACGLPAQVKPDWPALLCANCMEDLPRTQAGIAERLAATLARLDAAREGWSASVAASPAAERWAKVQEAMIGVAEKRIPQAAFDRQWALRLSEGGALAALLLAYEAHARECDAIQEELKRLDAAQDQINAAWMSTEV